jgi:Recombination directionality factor-like
LGDKSRTTAQPARLTRHLEGSMIHGLTPQFTEAGKVKLGGLGDERTTNAGKTWRMPVKYESFLLTKIYRDAKGDLLPDDDLMKAIKCDPDGKLRAIPIVLHSDEIDEVFPSQYARYAGKKLHCSGDGKVAVRWEITKDAKGKSVKTGESKQLACPCQFLEDRSCKPHAILYCSIRVPGLAVAGAIHTLRTTSIITIQRVIGSLLQIKKAVGMLQGLPLWLVVQPVPTDNGTVYCAHIELRAADVMEAQKTALEAAKMRSNLLGEMADLNRAYRAMLTAPASEDESDEEQAAVAAEFHPETDNNAVVDEPTRPPEGKSSFAKPRAPIAPSEAIIDGKAMDPRTGEFKEEPKQPTDPASQAAGF